MSRLIMWNLLSLDGFFQGGKSWELDWHPHIWCDELEHHWSSYGPRLLFGRVTTKVWPRTGKLRQAKLPTL
jgi:hypothetical protein